MNSLNSDPELDSLFRQALAPYRQATPPARARVRLWEWVQGQAHSRWRRVVARLTGWGVTLLVVAGSSWEEAAWLTRRPPGFGATLAADRLLALRFVA